MGPLVVILLGALVTFWWLGLLTPERMRVIAGIGGILIGLFMTARGQPYVGLPLVAIGGYLAWSGARTQPDAEEMTPKRAAKLLGVAQTASEDEIRTAYRLAVASAHPDKGGSSEQMQTLNRARDVLVAANSKADTE